MYSWISIVQTLVNLCFRANVTCGHLRGNRDAEGQHFLSAGPGCLRRPPCHPSHCYPFPTTLAELCFPVGRELCVDGCLWPSWHSQQPSRSHPATNTLGWRRACWRRGSSIETCWERVAARAVVRHRSNTHRAQWRPLAIR